MVRCAIENRIVALKCQRLKWLAYEVKKCWEILMIELVADASSGSNFADLIYRSWTINLYALFSMAYLWGSNSGSEPPV